MRVSAARVSEPATGDGGGSKLRYRASIFLIPLGIFLFALALRYYYIFYVLDHRVSYFGDAYNFLRTGSGILDLITHARGLPGLWTDFSALILNHHADSVRALGSMSLPDRLLVDGPVFPGFLAITEWLSGVNPHNPIYDAACTKLCLCNAVVDSLTCVFIYLAGRRAFNRLSGIVAALLFALYPAAIINTQHCYCEPFVYFLLSAWTCLLLALDGRIGQAGRPSPAIWLVFGLTTGLLMLAKPSFVLLPPFVGLAWLVVLGARGRQSLLQALRWQSLLTGALGLSMILLPWAWFNSAVTGDASILISRAPWYNLWQGNITAWDGWNVDPDPVPFPGTSKAVLSGITADATTHPVRFAGLELRKVGRLWGGVWNDYQYRLFNLDLSGQSLIHQILLLLGLAGFAALVAGEGRRWRQSQLLACGVLLATTVVFHFVYVAFETRYRYGITAMPAIILLGGYFLATVWNAGRRARLAAAASIGLAGSAFAIVPCLGVLTAPLAGMLPSNLIEAAPWLTGLFAAALLGSLVPLVVRSVLAPVHPDATAAAPEHVVAAAIILGAFVAIMLVAGACFATDPDWRRWSLNLQSTGQTAEQSLFIPAVDASAIASHTSFVLLDIDSGGLPPPVAVTVNGRRLRESLFPFAQIACNDADVIECLSIQGNAMGKDLRSFRQWWAVPVPSRLLKLGAENVIRVEAPRTGATVCMFGDYPATAGNGSPWLPSLDSFSYTKGFVTAPQDPRVIQSIPVRNAKSGSRYFDGRIWHTDDLAQTVGRQYGSYRIRLAVAQNEARSALAYLPAASTSTYGSQPQSLATLTLLGRDTEHLASGNNPLSMRLPGDPFGVPEYLPSGCRFSLSSQIKAIKSCEAPFISVVFSGLENGKTVSWSSPWQPISLSVAKDWRLVAFSDVIPERIVHLQHPTVSLLLSPFPSDLFFLKPKRAAKCKFAIRDASLSFLPSLDLPVPERRKWLFY